jgi:hypothetical protein
MSFGVDAEYKLSVSARLNAASGATPPTITEIEEVSPIGDVSYADALDSEGEASFSLEPERIPIDVADRFKNLRALPCELNIYRNDVIIWRGPILSCQLQGPTLTVNARGLLYYLRYMTLEANLLYPTATDQFVIGIGLVNAYQALARGNYGIDTSTTDTTSGVTRIRNYLYKENQNVFKRLQELADIDNGFDFWVDHANRKLMFEDEKGSDLSMSVYADSSNIDNPNVFWSVAADDIASEGIAVGTTSAGNQQSIVGVRSNTTLRDTFGRATVFQTADDVSTQATINDHAQRLVDSRAEQVFIPGPSVIVVRDVEPSDFSTGDLINYTFKIGTLGMISQVRRVDTRRVKLDSDGTETLELGLL